MVEVAERTVGRPPYLVRLVGWIMLLILYYVQVYLFVFVLAKYLNGLYVFWFIWFVPALLYVLYAFYDKKVKKMIYADNDVAIWEVWFTCGLYIVPYVITVAMIFGKVAHKLTKDNVLEINTLIYTMCITPWLLILLLQLAICPSYQKPVLSLSIFAALNIFDGIEMLKIILMQNEGNYDIDGELEICIVFFACLCFLVSPLGLIRNKFVGNGEVKQRKGMSMLLIPLEIIGINFSFLVLRLALWHKSEAPLFIAKNTLAIVTGGIEFFHLKAEM
ncbi:Hypothetical predicted protein [Paramuricea clavata]|uniref:Uncharacterized protein n=1 Tax=Paramuricea clavata TaxID=317549 RepID=A0A6S7G4D1_PARCT|nr:Hypothetical predicted protein [Paramuricea clavata]